MSLQFPELEHAAAVIEDGLAQDRYHDVHHWKFTPSSFDLFLRDLWLLGYQKLGHVGAYGTEGFEFFVTLGKDAGWPDVDRTELLLRVEAELAEPGLKDLRELHASLAAENDGLQRRVSELTAEVALMTGSRSWRMTSPLRRLNAARRRLVD